MPPSDAEILYKVIAVITLLVGLYLTIRSVFQPLLSLLHTLDVSVNKLSADLRVASERMEALTKTVIKNDNDNTKAHEHIFDKLEAVTNTIHNHDARIQRLEEGE